MDPTLLKSFFFISTRRPYLQTHPMPPSASLPRPPDATMCFFTHHHATLSLSIFFLLSSSFSMAQPPNDAREPYGNYARVTPAMAVIIAVLIVALFFMAFFSIFIRNCSERRGGGSLTTLPNGGRSRRAVASRGLDPAVIQTFPTLVYSEVKGLKIGKGALECAVCLCEFEDDESLRLIPKCDHVFHPDCIDVWLASHTTCPVCRANLIPQPGDPAPELNNSPPQSDLEAQNHAGVELESEVCDHNVEVATPEIEVMSLNQTLNRNRTRGSRSGRPRRFPRSHTTGHSLVQPGENVDRFTLRLPVEVRKQIMNRELNRTMSMVVFSRERSSRRGYKGGGEGSGRGNKYKRLERLDQGAKSDRWVFSSAPPFLVRASSFLTRASSSIRSPRVAAKDGEGTSGRPDNVAEPNRPPV